MILYRTYLLFLHFGDTTKKFFAGRRGRRPPTNFGVSQKSWLVHIIVWVIFMSIVDTSVAYNSGILRRDLIALARQFPFLNLQVVGKSILGDNIYVVKLGRGPKQVFYSGAIHRK